MSLPEKLKEVRKQHGYTRRQLAAELGRNYATITKYENGEREPGHTYLVEPMAMAAAAAGADAIMIEVHNDPPHALCDGAQSLTPDEFARTAKKIFKIREAMEG